ncbi:hypothetical protein C2G38_2173344 [Gigaspora rosea]|uniref:CCHC-type domain-containing protein n=1 Tax=Gigaspora rosea TaxID=44941 RepID=A0A397VJJ9_9GLOM|nr:hypothetical protein C2G38_2173344 [Gigaspora rosea]
MVIVPILSGSSIKFLTTHCKFGATVQWRFLEEKYSLQPIYSKDLYTTIQKFKPNAKTLLNDAASMSNWLDNKKMRILDGSFLELHIWMFNEILKATNRQSAIIMTDANPAVDFAIHQVFYVYQNSLTNKVFDKRFEKLRQDFPSANSYLDVLYWTKTYWALSFISYKFTGDEYLERFLTPIILQRQNDKMSQSVYYDATIFKDKDLKDCYIKDCKVEINNMTNVDIQQITLKQYYKDLDGSQELFLIAEKFINKSKSLNLAQQKIVYGKLHRAYKKAVQKVLQSKTKSQQLIELLQDFTKTNNEESDEESEMSEEEGEESEEESDANKENQEFILSNLKVRREKGRPPESKCLKSSHEPNIKGKQQKHCKKCGSVGHYQKKYNKI